MAQITETERKRILLKISVARKALADLELELGPTTPVSKRVNHMKEHARESVLLGTRSWRKPAELKMKKGA